MTAMPAAILNGRARRVALALAALAGSAALVGCGTGHPKLLSTSALAEAQTFPYYRLYWTGPRFDGYPLAAIDGQRSYIATIGDSVYYGDCVQSKGVFGGGSCLLPLQVTTVVYARHSNKPLGSQRNVVVRGVPATVYDEGRSIEIYTGQVAIDIFSDTFAHAWRASQELRPVNARGSAFTNLPPPVYCPGLSGTISAAVASVMAKLPRHVCQRTAAQQAYTDRINGRRIEPPAYLARVEG
jgi:hypothetical protein